MSSDFLGKPLTDRPKDNEVGLKFVGLWWHSRGDPKPLRLRPGYLAPIPAWSNAADGPEANRHAPLKDVIRRRGIALRLHLVAIYELQLVNRKTREWRAGPLAARNFSHDRPLVSGRLELPSWATLALGWEPEPSDETQCSAWRRRRYEAVANGFNRLAELELYDRTNRTVLLEDRPWRRGTVASPIYHSIARHDPFFEVPSEFFTSGDYLRLSGVETYALLTLLCEFQGKAPSRMVSRHGLTKAAWTQGVTELIKVELLYKYIDRYRRGLTPMPFS